MSRVKWYKDGQDIQNSKHFTILDTLQDIQGHFSYGQSNASRCVLQLHPEHMDTCEDIHDMFDATYRCKVEDGLRPKSDYQDFLFQHPCKYNNSTNSTATGVNSNQTLNLGKNFQNMLLYYPIKFPFIKLINKKIDKNCFLKENDQFLQFRLSL